MLRIGRRRAPKRHHAVADIFVQRARVLFDLVRNRSEVGVHRLEGFARLLIVVGVGRFAGELLLLDVGIGLGGIGVRQFREAAHVGEEHGDVAQAAVEIELLRAEQFVDDVGRNQFGKNILHPPLLALFKEQLISNETGVVQQQSAPDRQHDRQPITLANKPQRRHHHPRHRRPQHRQRRPRRPQPRRGHGRKPRQHQDRQQFRQRRTAPDEPPRQQRIGHVPMFAQQISLLLQRRRAHVRDVVPRPDRPDEDQLVSERGFDRTPGRAAFLELDDIFKRRLEQPLVIPRDAPVDGEKPAAIHGDDPLHAALAPQDNPPRLDLRRRQIQAQRPGRHPQAQVPHAARLRIVLERPGAPQHAI